MKLTRLLTLPLALSAAFAAPAQAESLMELYEAARAHDAGWQSAKAQYDANVARAEQAKAALLPTAGLAAGVTRNRVENVPATPDRAYTTQSASISASQPLYRPANLATFRQGKHQAQVAEYQLTQASQARRVGARSGKKVATRCSQRYSALAWDMAILLGGSRCVTSTYGGAVSQVFGSS